MRMLFVVRDISNAEPVGVMQLSACLKAAGHEVRLVGSRTTPLIPVMEDFRPQVVGYSACTGQHRYLLALNRGLKRRFAFLSLFGGPHPTFFPQMIEQPGVNMICRGEGEGAVLNLAAAIDHGADLHSIPNIWVNVGSAAVCNGIRPLVDDLDRLPFPDRELRYHAEPASRDYPVKSFLVSRGCPFRCSYCFNAGYAELYGPCWNRVRTRSPRNVVAEIRHVADTSDLEFVQFRESIFPWQPDWLAQFAALYRREVKLPFYCHVRADLLHPAVVDLLACAGCVSVNMGIECGDERYRRDRLNRPMTDEQIENACRLLKARGIRILADNMIALPGAPDDADRKTLELNRRCGVDYSLAMLFHPYPGTQLGRFAADAGFHDGHFDDMDATYYLRSPLRFANPRDKWYAENLQKWFAVLVEAPWLEPLIRPLLRRKPGLASLCIFRAWYMYCYTRRIVPHRVRCREWRDLFNSLLGRFPQEANRELVEEDGLDASAAGDDPAGFAGEPLHQGVQPQPDAGGHSPN